MAKLYKPKAQTSNKNLQPKPETVKFILSYSKALDVIKLGDITFHNIAN